MTATGLRPEPRNLFGEKVDEKPHLLTARGARRQRKFRGHGARGPVRVREGGALAA